MSRSSTRLGKLVFVMQVFSSFSWYTQGQQMKVEPEFLSSGEKFRGVYCRCSPLKISAEPIVVVILEIEL